MNPVENIKIEAAWLKDEALQKLFNALAGEDAQTRVVGGAVRNELMGESVGDVDLCTTLLPQEVIDRTTAADMKAVPTGIEHGTITVVIGGSSFEVTTLREDIETDGRHAVVKFGKDWLRDAQRRDLTINALYCDSDGNVYDPLNGYDDVQAREVRFIGDASERINEDALRILRFFRFFACYGDGRPDAAGLKACAANKALISSLSAERVWMEVKKIFGANDPGRALLWMRTTGILSAILPETEKWGIDAMPKLLRIENQRDWKPDFMLRIMAIIRPHLETVQGLAQRLSLSNKELERFERWAQSNAPKPTTSELELSKLLYHGSQQGIFDTMRIEAAHIDVDDGSQQLEQFFLLIDFAGIWQRPTMPVQGRDLIAIGVDAGPEMGEVLAQMEEAWIESGFSMSKDELLKLSDV